MDSIYTPIERVNLAIENTRVGQITDYDKLTLDVYTNGTLEPDEAVSLAAKVLSEHLNLFIDLSENAEYSSARENQAKLEARIKEIEYTLEHATIIENKGDGVIGVGSVVTIAYDEDDTEEYTIVGTNEADPFANKISNESPVGQALLGKKVGDVVNVETQAGVIQYKVLEIQRVS